MPEIPDLLDDPSVSGLPLGVETASRWMSKENLLLQEDADPQVFVALYDFQSGGENQLSLKKGIIIMFDSCCQCKRRLILYYKLLFKIYFYFIFQSYTYIFVRECRLFRSVAGIDYLQTYLMRWLGK